jgi:hypothetical protein
MLPAAMPIKKIIVLWLFACPDSNKLFARTLVDAVEPVNLWLLHIGGQEARDGWTVLLRFFKVCSSGDKFTIIFHS